MAFANWKSKKSQSATATLATVATHKGKTGDYLPSVATVATVAGLETSKWATNDHYGTFVVSEVSTNGENLKPTTDNLASEMSEVFPSSTHYPKSAVESIRLTQSEETYPPTVDGKLSPMEEVTLLTFKERYAHMVKCQQCEHLTDDGHCRVKPQYKPQPEAMRDCSSFEAVSGERVAITNAPYSASELNDLLSRYEKKLFDHLLKCKQCDFEAARYCAEVFTTGSSYDALLLVFDDAASKREALLNTVIRARISGRSVFVSIDHDNLPTPQQKPVKPLVYGIGDSERLFVDHLMTCKQCRPRSALYCADGLQLKANA